MGLLDDDETLAFGEEETISSSKYKSVNFPVCHLSLIIDKVCQLSASVTSFVFSLFFVFAGIPTSSSFI